MMSILKHFLLLLNDSEAGGAQLARLLDAVNTKILRSTPKFMICLLA